MNDLKTWYQSKTIWFNALYFVIAVAATFGWADFQPDTEVIGAVGVGGAPGGHLDEQCAVAALDKVKDLLK